jgi:hypothetical protein
LAEEMFFEQRKEGDTNTHEDGTRQKLACTLLLLMVMNYEERF